MSEDLRWSTIQSKRLEASRTAAAYVEKRLLPALGLRGARFELSLPGHGVRSLVAFLTVESGQRLVLRSIPKHDDARWLDAVQRLFALHGLPSPRVLHRDLSLRARWLHGGSVFAEEFVEGSALTPQASPDSCRAVGAAYARVHSVASRRWDRPDRQRRGDRIADCALRARRMAAEARRTAPGEVAAKALNLADWIVRERPPRPGAYELCHNRVTPTNVLVKPGESCVLIDLERVKFGSRLQELAHIRHDVFPGSQGSFEAFLEGYAKGPPAGLHPDADPEAWRWHTAFVRLKRAMSALRSGDARGAGILLDSSG